VVESVYLLADGNNERKMPLRSPRPCHLCSSAKPALPIYFEPVLRKRWCRTLEIYRQEGHMASDNYLPAKHTINSTQQDASGEDDAQLIAYYEEQRKGARSDEWIACLNAILCLLRQGRTAKSTPLF
jgi:hypothetical protein